MIPVGLAAKLLSPFSKGIAFTVILALLLGYIYYLNDRIDLHKSQAEALESHLVTVATERNKMAAHLEQVKKSITTAERSNSELRSRYLESSESKRELEKKLEKHDLEFLASRKPGLVSGVINRGVAGVFDDFETTTRDFYARGSEAAATTEATTTGPSDG